jgi:phosphatidylserine/phosphatidylglycerophosphate/cardiolipin synthase-like enzyme
MRFLRRILHRRRRLLTVGSANLNEHSFFNDTEMNGRTCDPPLARERRLRLWAEHLERSVEGMPDEPAHIVDALWRPIAREQVDRRHGGEPLTHRVARAPRRLTPRDGAAWTAYSLLVDG